MKLFSGPSSSSAPAIRTIFMKYLGITRRRRLSSLQTQQLPQLRSLAFLIPTALVILAVQQHTRITPTIDVPTVQREIALALPDHKSVVLEDAYRMFGRLPFEPDPLVTTDDTSASQELATVSSSENTGVNADTQQAWVNVKVAPGDNLSLIFSRLKLSSTDLHEIVSLGEATAPLKDLRPGQTLRFRLDDSSINEMVLELDKLNSLTVSRQDAGFVARVDSVEPDVKVTAVSTSIPQSRF